MRQRKFWFLLTMWIRTCDLARSLQARLLWQQWKIFTNEKSRRIHTYTHTRIRTYLRTYKKKIGLMWSFRMYNCECKMCRIFTSAWAPHEVTLLISGSHFDSTSGVRKGTKRLPGEKMWTMYWQAKDDATFRIRRSKWLEHGIYLGRFEVFTYCAIYFILPFVPI